MELGKGHYKKSQGRVRLELIVQQFLNSFSMSIYLINNCFFLDCKLNSFYNVWIAANGQVFAMAGQESSSADNQSSILFQKPNIRTDVQRCSVSPNRSQKKELKLRFIPVAPAIAKYPC